MRLTEKYPVLHPQVAARIIDGEAVIVLPQSSQVNVLNEVGSRIWEFIDGTRNVGEITEIIVAEYDVTAEQATSASLGALGANLSLQLAMYPLLCGEAG